MHESKNLYRWILGIIFVFAIIVRTYAFWSNSMFEDDECRLLNAVLDKNIWEMFLPLGNAQSAPPLFIIIEKVWGCLFNYSELAVKFIPYLCSIGSLFVFYKISQKLLKHKYSILIAMFLFSLNYYLVKFAGIIKQYSCDVLICGLCLYYFPSIDIAKLDKRNLILFGITITLLPFLSLPSLFFIGAVFVLNVIKNFRNKEFYKKLVLVSLPFLIVMALYYFYNLLPSQVEMNMRFPDEWKIGMITKPRLIVIATFVYNFKVLFLPNTMTLFELILFFTGLGLLFKEKDDFSKFVLLSFAFIMLASALSMYPFAGRVSMYSLLILIPLCLKPIDTYGIKSMLFWVFSLLTLIGFNSYYLGKNVIIADADRPAPIKICGYIRSLFKPDNYITYSPKSLMNILKERFDSKQDFILLNEASLASYMYYSKLLNFYPEKVFQLPCLKKENAREVLLDSLNEIASKQKCWLYLIKDYSVNPYFDIILDWANENNIIFLTKDRESYLIYVEKK